MNIILKLFYIFLLLSRISETEPINLEFQGKIKKVIKYEGTLSESRYFILEKRFGSIILFNEKYYSTGFEEYIDKYVIIKGQEITGFVGWKREKKKGYKVISIDILK